MYYPQMPPPYYPPPRPFRPGLAAKMGKPLRILIGVLTLVPFATLVAFLMFFLDWSSRLTTSALANQGPLGREYLVVFLLYATAQIVVTLGLLLLFAIDLSKNDRIAQDSKLVWGLVLFFGNVFALPLYWFLFFWRGPDQSPPPPQYPSMPPAPFEQRPPPR